MKHDTYIFTIKTHKSHWKSINLSNLYIFLHITYIFYINTLIFSHLYTFLIHFSHILHAILYNNYISLLFNINNYECLYSEIYLWCISYANLSNLTMSIVAYWVQSVFLALRVFHATSRFQEKYKEKKWTCEAKRINAYQSMPYGRPWKINYTI